ncbi:hypothetical protein JXA02_07890 [candidate division KSB1 bacterium]|nr:hypothetical protein [candidate division KSB1 bacterium]RQW06180.1 MAG: hypothetical protein EH222_09200 [candidate division KSB1 bacterium]
MMKKSNLFPLIALAGIILVCCLDFSCTSDDDLLAPYAGPSDMSSIKIEEGSYSPKVTWVGGFACVLGVNRGANAILDSSLVMLVYRENNLLRYPVSFGQTPSGAQDIAADYGGHAAARLREDNTYTFWVMQQKIWEQVAGLRDKILLVNSELPPAAVQVQEDTVYTSASGHAQKTLPLDVYVNFRNLRPMGRLAELTLAQTDTSNSPVITWTIRQADVFDDLVAAVGLVNAAVYDPQAIVWEAWSEEAVDDRMVYGKSNVIPSPLLFGDSFPGTRTFYAYPAAGLQRNQKYYFWIANKDWDGITHSRAANYYAYITFETF